MSIFRSLRWRLQIWHALVLVSVLLVFGTVVFYLQRQMRWQQLDVEMHRTTFMVAGAARWHFRDLDDLRRWPAREEASGAPKRPAGRLPQPVAERNDAPRPDAGKDEPSPSLADAETPTNDTAEKSSNEKPGAKKGRGRGEGWRWPPHMHPRTPEEVLAWTAGEDDQLYYFVVWNKDGELLQKSSGAPDNVPLPTEPAEKDRSSDDRMRQRDSVREEIHHSRSGLVVVVGRHIDEELAQQSRFALLLVLAGAGVLAVGLLGDWWIAGRAIEPVKAISGTAQLISAQNLSQRIDVHDTDSELGQLVNVLNSMFNRIEQAFAQQVRFTADASHELRTPLSVILISAEHALARQRSPEELREALATCRQAAMRMKSLIEDLLTLARLDSGEVQLAREPLDLAQIVEECVDLVEPLAARREVTIDTSLTSIPLIADPRGMSQVLINLLTNAIRYNRPAGQVRVDLQRLADQAVLTVSDTGSGIPGEDLPYVFDRFFCVDRSRSHAEGGSGLGLSICRTIIEAHHGEIRVVSSVVGEEDSGTLVEIRLPISDDAPVPSRTLAISKSDANTEDSIVAAR